ncbi:tripartite tricarboxylate transporter substrate binding protein, partial [Bordetella hinzii]|nr:tripartite tricarboxylate transporter substrate binding protein [Bordetella hinzii]
GTLDSIGAEPIGSSPEALRDHLAKETTLWARLVKERNIKIQ